MRAAYLVSPSFITPGRMEASKAALILIRHHSIVNSFGDLHSLLGTKFFDSILRIPLREKKYLFLYQCFYENDFVASPLVL